MKPLDGPDMSEKLHLGDDLYSSQLFSKSPSLYATILPTAPATGLILVYIICSIRENCVDLINSRCRSQLWWKPVHFRFCCMSSHRSSLSANRARPYLPERASIPPSFLSNSLETLFALIAPPFRTCGSFSLLAPLRKASTNARMQKIPAFRPVRSPILLQTHL